MGFIENIKEFLGTKRGKEYLEGVKVDALMDASESRTETFHAAEISTYRDYVEAIEAGKNDLVFMDFRIDGIDLYQCGDINLENAGIAINLEKDITPFRWIGTKITSFIPSLNDKFIKLSNLRGNKITGGLKDFVNNNISSSLSEKRYTFVYDESTFDEDYMLNHSEFFLSKDAPLELKDKYYKPLIVTKKMITMKDMFLSEKPEENDVAMELRQTLTYDEFIHYYEFLNGKYLGRFNMTKLDRSKINLVRALGLEQAKDTIERILDANLPLDLFLESVSELSLGEIKNRCAYVDDSSMDMVDSIDVAIRARKREK